MYRFSSITSLISSKAPCPTGRIIIADAKSDSNFLRSHCIYRNDLTQTIMIFLDLFNVIPTTSPPIRNAVLEQIPILPKVDSPRANLQFFGYFICRIYDNSRKISRDWLCNCPKMQSSITYMPLVNVRNCVLIRKSIVASIFIAIKLLGIVATKCCRVVVNDQIYYDTMLCSA